jgi:hypothetical protein
MPRNDPYGFYRRIAVKHGSEAFVISARRCGLSRDRTPSRRKPTPAISTYVVLKVLNVSETDRARSLRLCTPSHSLERLRAATLIATRHATTAGDIMAHSFRTAKKWMTKRVIPDYTNQLDLFSETPDGPSAPHLNQDFRNSAIAYALPRQQILDFGESEQPPLEERVATALARSAPASSGGDKQYKTPQKPPTTAAAPLNFRLLLPDAMLDLAARRPTD